MSFLKKTLFIFTVIITIGLLAYSTWHQWNDNQTTTLERMRPIAPVATFSHGGSISHIAYDPKNPEIIATAGGGNFVKVWHRNKPDSPQLSLEFQRDDAEFTNMIGIGFSPTENWIATKTFWTLEIWDSTSGSKISTLHIASSDFAISPLGNNIATDNVNLTLWDVNAPKNIRGKILLPPKMGWHSISLDGLERIDPYPEKNIDILRHNIPTDYSNECMRHRYRAIDFSHDGNWIAAAGEMLDENRNWRPHVKIWTLQKQQLYEIIDRDDPEIQEPKRKEGKVPAERSSTSKDIRSIDFSPDNRFFGLAANNGLTIWSLPEWKIYHEVLDRRISDIAFSPDGKMLAVCDVKGIALWSVDTLTPVALLATGGFLGSSVIEFSPDGRTLAGGGYGGLLQIWDVSKIHEN